jgi:hypothetical protein
LFVLIGCYYSGRWDEGVFCDKNRKGKMVRFNRVASGRCLCMGILGSSHVGERKPNTRPRIPSQSKIVKSPPSTHELLLLRHAAITVQPGISSRMHALLPAYASDIVPYPTFTIPPYPLRPPLRSYNTRTSQLPTSIPRTKKTLLQSFPVSATLHGTRQPCATSPNPTLVFHTSAAGGYYKPQHICTTRPA